MFLKGYIWTNDVIDIGFESAWSNCWSFLCLDFNWQVFSLYKIDYMFSHNYNSYTGYMQDGIKKQPQLVIKLRATFLKVMEK